MKDSTKKSITRRIATASGHLKGIERMVNEDVYCIDIMKQIQAVQSALNKVNTLILDQHLQTCVTTAIQGNDVEERKQLLSEISAVFEAKSKL
ncbi:MAG: metal-sensitive transcriptional regulator [Candidatus Promineifilaceae bacterium]